MKLAVAPLVASVVACSAAPAQVASPAAATAAARPSWVGIAVADAEASERWYRDNLHFTVTRRMDLPEHKLRIVFLELDGFTLELVEFQDAVSWQSLRDRIPDLVDRDKLVGFQKIGFVVSDVDRLAAELKRRGVALRMGPVDDKPFGHRFLLVEDNSGNLLQFFQPLR